MSYVIVQGDAMDADGAGRRQARRHLSRRSPTTVDLALAGAGMIASVHCSPRPRARPRRHRGGVTRPGAAPRPSPSEAGARPCPRRPPRRRRHRRRVHAAGGPRRHRHRRASRPGAAVLVEKPLATTLDDADRLVDAAAAGGACRLRREPGLRSRVRRGPAPRRASCTASTTSTPTSSRSDRRGAGSSPTGVAGCSSTSARTRSPSSCCSPRPLDPVSVSCRLHGADDTRSTTSPSSPSRSTRASTPASPRAGAARRPRSGTSRPPPDGTLRIELLPELQLEVSGRGLAPAHPEPPRTQIAQFGYLDQLETFAADFRPDRAPEMGAAFGRDARHRVRRVGQARHDGESIDLPFTGPRPHAPAALARLTDPTAMATAWMDDAWDPDGGPPLDAPGAFDDVTEAPYRAPRAGDRLVRDRLPPPRRRGRPRTSGHALVAVLDHQYDDPGQPWHGTFVRFPEWPRPRRAPSSGSTTTRTGGSSSAPRSWSP